MLRVAFRPFRIAVRSSLSRLLVLSAALLAVSARGEPAGAVSFVRVWPAWSDATPFDRISEYFDGRENDGGRIVVRTDPKVRSGLYYLVRVKNAGTAIVGARFVLEIIAPGNPLPRTYSFPADLPPGGKVCELGLTGADWPSKKSHPLAWLLTLADARGHTLAQAQSFLWSKP